MRFMQVQVKLEKPDEYDGFVVRKPVFRVSTLIRFKPTCSATETS